MSRFLACLFFAVNALGTSLPDVSLAQERYPSKPIRLIEPIPAGSVTDIVLRAAGQELLPRLGQPLIMEIRPGANMIIAAEACARAAPDGYTLCVITNDIMSYNPNIFAKLPYDPEKDFKPVTRLFRLVSGLMVTASVPANSVKELQALASAKPGWLNFATHGPGSATDISRQWFGREWKTDFAGIPYKGGAQIISALVAGEIQVAWIGVGNLGGQLRTGKVKILAVSGAKRSPVLPEVPTRTEAGLGEFPVAWWGLAFPAGTPDSIVARLDSEFARLLREQKFNEYLENQFLEPAALGSEAFASFLKADRERIAQLVKIFNVPRQ